MSDPLLDIVAAAMMTQDAQDSMSSASWQDLAEGERDEWRRIADAGIAALRDAGHLLPDYADRIDPDAWPAAAECREVTD